MSRTISVPLTTDKPEDPQVRAALADIAAGNYSVAIAWLHEAQRVQQAHAAALVNVPLLRYGDPCRHGFLTYTLDGDTFHRATLGRCIDAPPSTTDAPGMTVTDMHVYCAHCTSVFDDMEKYTQHIAQAHKPPVIPM